MHRHLNNKSRTLDGEHYIRQRHKIRKKSIYIRFLFIVDDFFKYIFIHLKTFANRNDIRAYFELKEMEASLFLRIYSLHT